MIFHFRSVFRVFVSSPKRSLCVYKSRKWTLLILTLLFILQSEGKKESFQVIGTPFVCDNITSYSVSTK